MIRVLLIAPGNEIVGGQTVQAVRLMELFENSPDVALTFQAINPLFPGPLRWVKKVPVARTVLNALLCWTQVFYKTARTDISHIFTAGLYSYMLWTVPALIAAKVFGKKSIVHYHDGQAEIHLNTHRIAKPTLLWADAIVTPSEFLVDVFRRHGIPARSIFNVIDVSPFMFRRRSRLKPRIMTNRMLEPLYNVACVLRAFGRVQTKYPDASLIIAHHGFLRAQLEQTAQDLGLRNVRFIGAVAMAAIPKLYDDADIYVMTPNIDNMPVTLLECMASGIPIVSTNAGGIPYVVTNEKTALLVEIDDDKAAAAQIIRLLEDPALVERLTEAGQLEVSKYRGEPVRRQWIELYRELCGSPSKGK
jgi:glycosyltransferase involved in cell wall biosynthesis